MADNLSWRGHAGVAGAQRDVNTMELVEQLLRGNGYGSAVGQRSASSGRNPRMATDTTRSKEHGPSSLLHGRGEAEAPAPGRSPRPRSVSVGRRQQDVQELASVMQELHSKGRVIQNISLLQELPQNAAMPRSGLAGGGGVARDGSTGFGTSFGTSSGGGGFSSSRATGDARGYGGSLGGASRGLSGGAGVSGGGVSGSGASGSAMGGRGVTRSILGGVESLASKLEMLNGRLTPKKASPNGDYHSARRDGPAMRHHHPTSTAGARDGAPNFRELLAAANAGLLQGSGLQDTFQGSRDQRPPSGLADAAYTSTLGGRASGGHLGGRGSGPATFGTSSAVRDKGGDSSTGAGGSSNLYSVGSASAELTTSMILQNRRLSNEDILAADRLLQSLQADIRGGAPAAAAGSGSATAAAPTSVSGPSAPAPERRATREAGPAAAAAAGSAGGDALASAAVGNHRYGGGMLQSFFATLSEAVSPPRSPVAQRPSGAPAPAATPAAPVIPAHVPAAGQGPFAYANANGTKRHSATDIHQPGASAANARDAGRQAYASHLQQHERRSGRYDAVTDAVPADASARAHATLEAAAAALHELPSAGEPSATSTAATGPAVLQAELGPRLSELQRLTESVARGYAALEQEGSAGSTSVSGGGLGPSISGGGAAGNGVWLGGHPQLERREQRHMPAAAGPSGQGRGYEARNSSSAIGAHEVPPHMPRARAAWTEDASPSTGAAGSSATGEGLAGSSGRGGHGGGRDGAGGMVSAGHRESASTLALPVSGYAAAGAADPLGLTDGDGIHMALLKQQRRKERERREEKGRQEVADAAAAASRAQQQAVDWREQHDRLMTQYLATRQRLEALEAVQERIVRDGCSGCERLRQQLQQASDDKANTAAQLRDVRTQLQEARSQEESTRRQLAQTTASVNDQAAAGELLRTTLQQSLKELLDLAAEASSALSPSGGTGLQARSSLGGSSGGGSSGGAADVEALLELLQLKLRDQTELARRQRQLLETAQDQLVSERSASASDRAESAARAARELDFQRNRAEGLQEELDRHRELVAKLELRVRQIEDERDRAVRQRDTAELSLEAQKAQLETARQQQDTLVGRMFEAQRAREDADVLVSQVRSLSQQLEAARASAARAEALERKVSEERDAKEELLGRVSELQSQLKEREAALEAVRRQAREQEATTNSAVASRQVVMEQASKRSDEIRTLTQENAKMFHHLENLQLEKKKAESQVAQLSSQLLVAQEEASALRAEVASLREQLAGLQNMQPLQDATLAQHQLSGELLKAQAEVAALRTLGETLGDYADSLKRALRRHGLAVPEMPGSAEVVSQIGTLQAKLAAEADAAAAARGDASHLRGQLDEAKAETERLKRELQLLSDKYAKLESSEATSTASWQAALARSEAAQAELANERDGLQQELHTLRAAGTEEVVEMRSKVMRLEVQVEALGNSKRQEQERARALAEDLGSLRKSLLEKDEQVERLRLACDEAKAAAEQAEAAQKAAEAEAAAAVAAQQAAEEEARAAAQKIEELQAEVARLETALNARTSEYAGLYDYCAEVIAEKEALAAERARFTAAADEAAAEVEALRQEAEALRAELADKEQRLLVKPKMAELQYRVNELAAQLAEVTDERDAAKRTWEETARKLQEETEQHFETDGRRVRLGEEAERLRGILRMYSIPF